MTQAKFLFSLVRPDDKSWEFQSDFDTCISTATSIVEHFREIKTAEPFISVGHEVPSFNFAHDVFKHVRP